MKYLLRTIYFLAVMIPFMLLSFLLFIPYGLLKLFRLKKAFDVFTHRVTSTWGKVIFAVSGCRITTSGLENLPDHSRIIYIANHQGYGDIPFMMSQLPTTVGFIAKKELAHVPLLGPWEKAIHCIFIDRGNFRAAMRDIENGIKEAADGYPKVIFPEGTRSKSSKMASFKPGSILLAAKAGLTIVPVTIDGTWKAYEDKKMAVPSDLSLTVHPPIETEGMSDEEKKELSGRLWDTIAGALPNKGA